MINLAFDVSTHLHLAPRVHTLRRKSLQTSEVTVLSKYKSVGKTLALILWRAYSVSMEDMVLLLEAATLRPLTTTRLLLLALPNEEGDDEDGPLLVVTSAAKADMWPGSRKLLPKWRSFDLNDNTNFLKATSALFVKLVQCCSSSSTLLLFVLGGGE